MHCIGQVLSSIFRLCASLLFIQIPEWGRSVNRCWHKAGFFPNPDGIPPFPGDRRRSDCPPRTAPTPRTT